MQNTSVSGGILRHPLLQKDPMNLLRFKCLFGPICANLGDEVDNVG